MYQTLYRKYRPRTFSDVCGQERVTSVLRRQVAEGTATHAYLFCGTRGTGKTTCAKILAKVSNCENPQNGEPCNQCDNCLAADRGELVDILEVDAASNTGVDNIRKLCEDLNFLPAQGKKRVYIIDEVHMLSIGAFNALLKTLEEPPAHALFILATTELNKVPATVRSRCQSFTFRRLSVEDIADRVLYVSERESIPLDASGARLIARLSDGAMRDALSLLELCVGHEGKLDEDTLNSLFGLGEGEKIKELSLSLLKRDATASLSHLEELYRSLGDLKEILSQVLGAFRDMLLARVGAAFETGSNRTEAQQAELTQAAKSVSERELLYAIGVLEETLVRFERLTVSKKTLAEMAFLKICYPQFSDGADALSARLSALEQKLETASFVKAPQEAPVVPSPEPPMPSEEAVPWREEAPSLPPVPAPAPQPAPEKKTAPDKPKSGGCSYAGELIDALVGKNPMLSAFCKQVELVKQGTVLTVYGEAFTLTMLRSQENEILSLARGYDPELSAVRFSEGHAPSAPDPAPELSQF